MPSARFSVQALLIAIAATVPAASARATPADASCVYLALGCYDPAPPPIPTLLPGPLYPPLVPGLAATSEASPQAVAEPDEALVPVRARHRRHAHARRRTHPLT